MVVNEQLLSVMGLYGLQSEGSVVHYESPVFLFLFFCLFVCRKRGWGDGGVGVVVGTNLSALPYKWEVSASVCLKVMNLKQDAIFLIATVENATFLIATVENATFLIATVENVIRIHYAKGPVARSWNFTIFGLWPTRGICMHQGLCVLLVRQSWLVILQENKQVCNG